MPEWQWEHRLSTLAYSDDTDSLGVLRAGEATPWPASPRKIKARLDGNLRDGIWPDNNNRRTSYKQKPESNVALRLRNIKECCLELESQTQLYISHLREIARQTGNRA